MRIKKAIIYVLGISLVILLIIAVYGKIQPKIVAAEIYINAPKEKVWEVWSQFDNVSEYVPWVSNAYTVGEISSGLGHSRRCDIAEGVFVEEKITRWDPLKGYAIEIYHNEGTMVDKMQVDLKVVDEKSGTKATITMDYKMKGLIDFIPTNGAMQEQAVNHLLGVKYLVETGNKTTEALLEELRSNYAGLFRVL